MTDNAPVPVKNGAISKEFLNSLSGLISSLTNPDPITSFQEIYRQNITSPLTLDYTKLMYMFKTHGELQTVIEVPVLDALRGGVDIHSGEMDTDDIKKLDEAAEETNLYTVAAEAENWARLFGGAAIIVNTEQNPETPLSEKQLAGKIEFYAASRWELLSKSGFKPGYTNALDSYAYGGYSTANDDYFYFYGKKIHRSRVIILAGKRAPYILRWQLQGWGMSEYERMVESFNLYIRTKSVIYDLLREAKVDVFRLAGLNDTIGSDIGQAKVYDRISMANKLKSYQGALVMDVTDEFEQKQITFAGLAEVMKINQMCVAAALRIPMTKLFGISASGFNSGEDDIENYNAMVESEVRHKLRRPLKKMFDLLALAMFGYKPEFTIEFRPLRVLGAQDEEIVKKSKSDRFLALYDRGLLNSKEMGDIMEKEKMLPIQTEAAAGTLEDHPQVAMAGGEEGASGGESKPKGKKEKE